MPWAVIKTKALTLMQGQYIVEHVGPIVKVGDNKGGRIVHIFKKREDAVSKKQHLNSRFIAGFLRF